MSETPADYFAEHARFARRKAAERQKMRLHNGRLTASESQEQQALIQRAYNTAHTSEYGVIWKHLVAIPNGADTQKYWDYQRGEHVSPNRERLLKEGIRPGFPDLQLCYSASGYHGLFIEMKSVDGRLRKSQAYWRDVLTKAGYGWRLCRSADEAWAVLVDYISGGFKQ